MANRRELVVALVSDASQFKRGFNDAERSAKRFGQNVDTASKRGLGKMNSRVSALTGTVRGFGLAVGAAFTVNKVVDFTKEAIRSASDLNESVNAVRVTFGDSADDILAIGENAAQSFGLAQSEFNQFAVAFSSFGETIAEGTGQDVSTVINDLTTRIADFASVMNLEVPEAAAKFRSALAGEVEPVRAFGIDMSAAAVNAKALEVGLAGTTQELTQGDKVLARYLILMDETSDVQGDFANTSGDFANAQRIFNKTLEDARAAIGEDLLPVMADLIKTGENLIPVMVKLGKVLGLIGRGLAITLAADEFERFEITAGHTAGTAENLVGVLSLAADEFDAGAGKAEGFRDKAANLDDTFRDLIRRSGATTDELIRLSGGLDFLVEAGHLTERQAESLGRILTEELATGFAEAEGAGKNFARGMEHVDASVDADRVLRNYADAVSQVGDELASAVPSAQDMAEAIAAVNSAMLEAANPVFRAATALSRYEETLEEVNEDGAVTAEESLALAEAALEANAALGQLGSGNVNAGIQAIADALGQPFGVVQDLLIELGILEDELRNLDGTRVNLLFSASMPAADRALLNKAGSIAGSTPTIKTAPGRAHGGPVTKGRGYIVGERGPELFYPSQSGQIIPGPVTNATSTMNVSIATVPERVVPDLQRELLLASVSRWAEVN